MSTMPITIMQQVRWQDLTVRNEVDIVLDIAQQEGWRDCEIFGFGDMISEPQDSLGWELIPADVYKYSIPAEGVRRVHQVINAGIRIQGIIIADDERNAEPSLKSDKSKISLLSIKTAVSSNVSSFVTAIRSWVSKALIGLMRVAGLIIGAIAIVSLIAVALKYLWPLILFGFLIGAGSSTTYDPKLVILVDDGNGGTVWISLFTWYE